MNSYRNLVLFFLVACWSGSGFAQEELTPTRPKLVVGIVIDQMRAEYLDRYGERFGENGFNRLIRDGYHCRNNHYSYIPTFTGPGHASIYTGTTPNNHGIVANSWFDLDWGKSRYCALDTKYKTVGNTKSDAGKRSPTNLLSTTVTDEWRMATRNRAKVVGVSLKDRSAIFPAGHNPTGAYWMDFSTGTFVTSTYYQNALPDWVRKFNSRGLTRKYLSKPWKTLHPISSYVNSNPDVNDAEMPVKGMTQAKFPHPLPSLIKQNGYGLLGKTPFGNSIVTELAMAAIKGEDLGKDDDMDFLAVSYSSTDMVGHQYGPRSIEVEDTYLRLDEELAALLEFLDNEVGAGQYTVFVTADHGGNEALAQLEAEQMPGRQFSLDKLEEDLEKVIAAEYGEGDWVAEVTNEQIYLNVKLIEEKKMYQALIEGLAKKVALSTPGVANALLSSDLKALDLPVEQRDALLRGFNPKRSGHVLLLLEPGWMDYPKGGTTHGSGYNYDTHVPLIWYGFGVPKGETVKYTTISQIASTLSFLLHVPLPSAANPNPIEGVLESEAE